MSTQAQAQVPEPGFRGTESLSCVIFVKGGGNGRSKPKKDHEGKVSEFLRDWTPYYKAVFEHVKVCKVCKPDDVLHAYLLRRTTDPKFNGETSKGLCDLAWKYGSKLGASRSLVDKFYVLSAEISCLSQRRGLSPCDLLEGVKMVFKRWTRERKKWAAGGAAAFNRADLIKNEVSPSSAAYHLLMIAASCFDDRAVMPPDDEMLRLATVAEVMGT